MYDADGNDLRGPDARKDPRAFYMKNYKVTKIPEADCVIGVSNAGGFYLVVFDGGSVYPSLFGLFYSAESRQSVIDRHIAERKLLYAQRKQKKSYITSVTIAPWVMETLELRRQELLKILEIAKLLTTEQLVQCVMACGHDAPGEAVARFFLQEISRRNQKMATEIFRKWRDRR